MIAGLVLCIYGALIAAVTVAVMWHQTATPVQLTAYELHRKRFIETGEWAELEHALQHLGAS